MNILLSNDDGVHAPGLVPLRQALASIGHVTVVAPQRNQSAVSHKVTMHKPVRLGETALSDGSIAIFCSGTPADAVRMGLSMVLDAPPDIIVSGINIGHNMGIDVNYSGTVACAREGVIHGIPSFAVSSVFPSVGGERMGEIWETTAAVSVEIIQEAIAQGLPPLTLLNINTPGLTRSDLKGIKITHIGARHYDLDFSKREDPLGRDYYWPLGGGPFDEYDPDSDVGAVADGYVSVTPISADPTDAGFKKSMAEWNLEQPVTETTEVQ